MPPQPWIDHVALTVTDLDRSARWYQRLFGLGDPVRLEGPGWRRVLLRADGFALSLSVHDGTDPADAFDERRVGLDHLSIGCRDGDELEAWVAHLEELGVPHAAVTRTPQVQLVACHDPDGIAVEFFWRLE